MNKYIRLSDNSYPIHEHQVRQSAYPTALGEVLLDSVVSQYGYAKVTLTPPPSEIPLGYYLVETSPTLTSGSYLQSWEVVAYDLETKKAIKLQHFNQLFNSLIGQVKTTYPDTEVESWAKQEKEAREYLADNSSQALLVRSIAISRGVSLEYLANKIVEKSDLYAAYVGNLIGTRQLLEYQITNATEDTINGIVWPPE
jgi:hypothetical protein